MKLSEKVKNKLQKPIFDYVNNSLLPAAYDVFCDYAGSALSKDEFCEKVLQYMKPQEVDA